MHSQIDEQLSFFQSFFSVCVLAVILIYMQICNFIEEKYINILGRLKWGGAIAFLAVCATSVLAGLFLWKCVYYVGHELYWNWDKWNRNKLGRQKEGSPRDYCSRIYIFIWHIASAIPQLWTHSRLERSVVSLAQPFITITIGRSHICMALLCLMHIS